MHFEGSNFTSEVNTNPAPPVSDNDFFNTELKIRFCSKKLPHKPDYIRTIGNFIQKLGSPITSYCYMEFSRGMVRVTSYDIERSTHFIPFGVNCEKECIEISKFCYKFNICSTIAHQHRSDCLFKMCIDSQEVNDTEVPFRTLKVNFTTQNQRIMHKLKNLLSLIDDSSLDC